MKAIVRGIRSDDAGVASTVGTTMALLVFLTFMSLIVNQYVPAWMKESEAAHSNVVIGQFGGLKGDIDVQILSAYSAVNNQLPYVPAWATTAISLGVDGVPVFSSPTPSTMTALPTEGPFTVVFDYNIQGVRTRVSEVSNGSVDIDIHNRYYVPQRISYENGAVIRWQADGQVVRGPPTFLVNKVNNALDIQFGLVTLYGGGTAAGTNTEVINSQLFALDFQRYVSFPANAVLWINHTSRYGLAWYHFFNQTLASALNLGGTFTRTALDITFTARIGPAIIYIVTSSFNPTNQLYNTRLEIRNAAGLLTFREIHLVHSHVQVRVGDTTQRP